MVGFTVGTVLIGAVIFSILRFGANMTVSAAFDRSYYISVLSFLWMHYYHDHFLFTQPQAMLNVPAAALAA